MIFCPECQYLNPSSAMTCQSCGAPLTALIEPERPLSNDMDTISARLGVMVLATLAIPWVVGTGTFTISAPGAPSTNVNLIAFGFPLAQYSYFNDLGQGAWSAYLSVQYAAVLFVLVGGVLIIATSLSARYKNLAGTGALFSALAPVPFLGFSQSSGQTTQAVTSSNFVIFPVGIMLPILFGLLVMGRVQKWDEPPRFSPSTSYSKNPSTLKQPNVVQTCPACGSGVLASHKFCETCGKNLEASLMQY